MPHPPLAAKNCTLTVEGWSTRYVNLVRLSHGMNIQGTRSEGRHSHWYSTKRVTTGSFTLGLEFGSHREYERMARWFKLYGEQISRPQASSLGPMRVQCAARNFDRLGVPNTPIPFGDRVGALVYRMSIGFVGVSLPLDPTVPYAIAEYQRPTTDLSEGIHYYPDGIQLGAGGQTIDGLIYGTPQGVRPIDVLPESRR